MRRVALKALSTAVLATMIGCNPIEGPVDPPQVVDPHTDETIITWPFWPTSLRVHPLTRLTRDAKTGDRVLEVRFEFVDRYGHTTKALGKMRVDLYDADAPSSVEILQWNVDLQNLHDNLTYYDEVTRTYLLRIVLDEEVAALPRRGLIHVFFLSARERMLDAKLVVEMQE
jgi:hypothetical protein